MTRRRIPVVVVGVLLMLAAIVQYQSPTLASSPGNAAFERTWSRTDRPVADQSVNRTWMWGPEAFTEAIPERYDGAPGGQRTVQYFDKSRMEINHDPNVPEDSPWHVTNGLLVVELMTGRMQVGDNSFDFRDASMANVAGDQGNEQGVTYRFMSFLRDQPALPEGSIINKVLTPFAGSNLYLFSDDLGALGITASHYVPETQHTVAAPFWDFMNSWGTISQDGGYVDDQLFLNPFYATGFPITEAYWASVPLAGVQTDVLVQCFEHRCLTYTPDNPEGWKVEAGNVGQHYHAWRYGMESTPEPIDPSPEASPTQQTSITATATTTPILPTITPTIILPTPTATSTPIPPTLTPTLIPETLSDAYLHPDNAAIAARSVICGCQPSTSNPLVATMVRRSFVLPATYNLVTTVTGSFNRDTTGYYDWQSDYVRSSMESGPDPNMSAIPQQVIDQFNAAIYQPESAIGQQIRRMERGQDPLYDGLSYRDTDVWWHFLFEPNIEFAGFDPVYQDAAQRVFESLVTDYLGATYNGFSGDFGAYLASQQFKPY